MTRRFSLFKSRADAFCAKLNDGLTAVALVLAMAVFMVGTYRTLELLESTDLDNLSVSGQWVPQQQANN